MNAHIYDRLVRFFQEGRWFWSIGPQRYLVAAITLGLGGTTRRVELRVDPAGRCMEALDRCGYAITCVDLQHYESRPASDAVADLVRLAYGVDHGYSTGS